MGSRRCCSHPFFLCFFFFFQLPSLHSLTTVHVLHLSSVQELILQNLDDLPEWRSYLTEALPDFSVDKARHRASEIFRDLQVLSTA